MISDTKVIDRVGTLCTGSTCFKYIEKGKPSSRAKAHVMRDTDARVPNIAAMVIVSMKA